MEVYFGNLPKDFTENEFAQLARLAGKYVIIARLVHLPDGHLPSGFAEYLSEKDAAASVQAIEDDAASRKPFQPQWARFYCFAMSAIPKRIALAAPENGAQANVPRQGWTNVYIKNLPPAICSRARLFAFIHKECVESNITAISLSARIPGSACVQFSNPEDAHAAIKALNGNVQGGEIILAATSTYEESRNGASLPSPQPVPRSDSTSNGSRSNTRASSSTSSTAVSATAVSQNVGAEALKAASAAISVASASLESASSMPSVPCAERTINALAISALDSAAVTVLAASSALESAAEYAETLRDTRWKKSAI